MVEPILPVTLDGAVVRKGGKLLVGPVSTRLSEHGLTAVMGANGSGKTSLLRMINGLERVVDGAVVWNVATKAALQQQAFVFQMPILLRRTVLANMIYPLSLKGVNSGEANRMAKGWIERIGLSDVEHQPATVLSGGEKQKLALARALVASPQLLILDEPTANLDGVSIRDIETILKEIRTDGTRIIMSTHNIGQAQRLADEVLFLHKGQLLEQGNAKDFFAQPQSREARAFVKGDIVE